MTEIVKAEHAAPHNDAAAMKVKPLEWLSEARPFYAVTPFCTYRIGPADNTAGSHWETVISYRGTPYRLSSTEEEAKAAAQADYEQRIRSALSIDEVDSLRSSPTFHVNPVEQLAFELAWELEEAELNSNDLVTINRDKLKAIARRVVNRATSAVAPPAGDAVREALLRELQAVAEKQKAYFSAKQREFPNIEDFTDADGNLSLPDDISPLLKHAEANGRYSEADWWLSTIRAARTFLNAQEPS